MAGAFAAWHPTFPITWATCFGSPSDHHLARGVDMGEEDPFQTGHGRAHHVRSGEQHPGRPHLAVRHGGGDAPVLADAQLRAAQPVAEQRGGRQRRVVPGRFGPDPAGEEHAGLAQAVAEAAVGPDAQHVAQQPGVQHREVGARGEHHRDVVDQALLVAHQVPAAERAPGAGVERAVLQPPGGMVGFPLETVQEPGEEAEQVAAKRRGRW
ncbi:hypothetical protein LUW77_28325 [Streptomyces radiopugnans]|nr:hypothetical protein LUW77_28325 [Streptomyces radiopugnans]